MAAKYCYRNKFGYCSQENFCRYIHTSDICEDENCLKIQCNKRHPRECSYFSQFQRCKFSNCAYKHIKKFSEKDVQELIKRVVKLETNYNQDKTANKTLSKSEVELENLKKEVLNLKIKVEELTSKLNDSNVTQTEESFLESTSIDMDMSLQTLIRVNSGWKCDYCDKVVKSDKGLKKHMKFMHGFKCDFCGQRFQEKNEIENHWSEMHKAFKTFDLHDFDGYLCEICYEKEMEGITEPNGIRPYSGEKATIDKADEYDVDELNEHLETVHNVKKKKYNLRKN